VRNSNADGMAGTQEKAQLRLDACAPATDPVEQTMVMCLVNTLVWHM
jgi:hypothetical protein